MGGTVHTKKKNTKASIVAIKDIGLEVNVDKIKYIITSRAQNKLQIYNNSFDMVKYIK
jgi:hypothetical protein